VLVVQNLLLVNGNIYKVAVQNGSWFNQLLLSSVSLDHRVTRLHCKGRSEAPKEPQSTIFHPNQQI